MIKHFWAWLQELFNPRLKCWRRGSHHYETIYDRIMFRVSASDMRWRGPLAELYYCSRRRCYTCGHRHKGPWVKGEHLESYHSVTMDGNKHREYVKRGWTTW